MEVSRKNNQFLHHLLLDQLSDPLKNSGDPEYEWSLQYLF